MDNSIQSAKAYYDFSQFADIKSNSKDSQDDALRAAAKQFESLFLKIMLKSMRDANASFAEDNFMNSESMNFYQDMYDQQMSVHLSQNNGIGLAEALVRQLGRAQTEFARENTNFSVNSPSKTSENTDKLIDTIANKIDEIPVFKNPIDFVKSLWPHAKKIGQKIGLDPKMLIAQAALETGWGKHIIANKAGESSFNLFNIKAGSSWQRDKVHVPTLEYENGIAIKKTEPFRKYQDFTESFDDYYKLISRHQRYDVATQSVDDPIKYITEIQKAGYATDPNYANKVARIYSGEVMSDAINAINGVR